MAELGVLDALVPLLTNLDSVLSAWLPRLLRLVLWITVAVVMPWWLARLLIPWSRVAGWRRELYFQQQLRRTFKNLKASLPGNRRRIAILTSLLALSRIPVLILCLLLAVMILVWIPRQFAYAPPYAGQWIVVMPQLASGVSADVVERIQWQPREHAAWSGDLQAWVVRWPNAGHTVSFYPASKAAQAAEPLFTIAARHMGVSLVKRRWWHVWLANPAGYVTPDYGLTSVSVALTPYEYLPWGPVWLRHWWGVLGILLIIIAGVRSWLWWRKAVTYIKQPQPGSADV